MKKVFVLCFVILFSATFAYSQHSPLLGNFSLFQNNGKVILNWQILAGSTCNGIQIFRSTDNIYFNPIGEIIGVCGDVTQPVSYNFTDEHPIKNKINYYKLELGNTGPSPILFVEIIDIENGGYQIRPNPVSTEAKIYFGNDKKSVHQLLLYNQNGVVVTTLSAKEDFFIFNTTHLPDGIYLFTISDTESTVKGKGRIVVQH